MINHSGSLRQIDLTVVITTLGGDKLSGTLECLKKSTVRVSKIFLCIPHEFEQRVWQYGSLDSVVIIPTNEKGQVVQRIAGFKSVTTRLVLQLDDDIYFEPDSVERIYQAALELGPGHAVGGTINRKDDILGRSNRVVNFFKLVRRRLLKLLAEAPVADIERSGRYSKFTWCQPVRCDPFSKDAVFVDFLPGGFCVSWRSDLVLENYFPIKGKAYKEDLLHSFERSKKGIKHAVLPSVIITTEEDQSPLSYKDFISEFRANRMIGIRLGCHSLSPRLYLYIILEIAFGAYRRSRLRRRSCL